MGSLIENMPNDFTKEEKRALTNYVDNGVPGLSSISDSDVFKWFQFYMTGKTYSEIAIAYGIKKDVVLFMAHKGQWFDKRMQHFSDLVSGLGQKISITKVESANTIATMLSGFNKYYNDEFTQYLKTKDAKILEKMNTKLLGQYQKAVDLFEKIIQTNHGNEEKGNKPIFNINVNTKGQVDVNVEEDDGIIDVTEKAPNPETLGEILKLMSKAKQKKQQEGE